MAEGGVGGEGGRDERRERREVETEEHTFDDQMTLRRSLDQ